ncbi:calcium/proton exchanger [Iningainema tapete]|uniref:Ca(2+)/H(+) antiporter n=1 Tax=Iningainema tapete BLCC-T55 TaxID=2748662 RepID=A0A8J6XLN3_9CYAN|nr:calcium/proton exchanger [Iningainema tapete]MBD2772717.1 calcium/proton exchanger [Iningainema tapete BLCC-T55]
MNKKDLILRSMLVFVPVAITVQFLHLNALVIFITSGLAIIPLAALIAESTEEIAEVIGPAFGGLLNATFGNATEMIISIVALRAGLVDVVKASLTGAIIANLLFALGLATLFGGLRFKEQVFPPAVARLNASSLTLAVIVLVTPAAIQLTSKGLEISTLNNFSYVAAILLLVFYCLMLLFSMKTHKDFYVEDTEIALTKEAHKVNLWLQVTILLITTVVLVFVSDILVESLETATSTLGLTSLFTGVILIPIFGGIVEYITCVTFAVKNKMELAVAVAIGSSLQIAMFVAPILVIVGFIIGEPMNLRFNLFELVAVAMAVVSTNSISNDGRSNWLEGVLLLITYAVLGVAFYFHP